MIKAMVHVGISVSNLERAITFYRDGFGMDGGIIKSFGGPQYEALLQLDGVSGRVAMMRRDNFQLELFAFENPKPAAVDHMRPVSDQGITHFCVEVEDIDSAVARLEAVGATFHCPPLLFFGTTKATYGRDPDGNAFELIEYGVGNE